MSNERAINQIKKDIENLRDSIRWRQADIDKAIISLTDAKTKIDELSLNIKNQEAAIKILQEDK